MPTLSLLEQKIYHLKVGWALPEVLEFNLSDLVWKHLCLESSLYLDPFRGHATSFEYRRKYAA